METLSKGHFMKRLGLVLLTLALCLASARVQGRNSFAVQVFTGVLSGDLNLAGNNVTIIEGHFDIDGNLIVTQNATLILRNAIVNIVQHKDFEHGIVLTNSSGGRPTLEVSNTIINSTYKYSIDTYQNSSISVHDSNFTAQTPAYGWISLHDSSSASFQNVTVHGLNSMTKVDYVIIENSSIDILNIYGPAAINYSNITQSNSYGSGLVLIGECSIAQVQTFDISGQGIQRSTVDSVFTYNESSTGLISCNYSNCGAYDESRVFVGWYLDVQVIDSIGQMVPYSNITYYDENKIWLYTVTDSGGQTTLELAEKIINATGMHNVEDHLVIATKDGHSNQTTVTMNENKKVTIRLEGLVIPEFPSTLILPLIMLATLLTVAIYKGKIGYT